MKKLEYFLRPTQERLFSLLCEMYRGKVYFCKGSFILVKGNAPILFVAHLDTVHENPVRDIYISEDGNILMSPQGIGGDDRCGVYALAKIYEKSEVKPFLLFTCDEEIGGIGARSFYIAHQQKKLPIELDSLKMIIEIDRKGENDAVYYDCDNPNFEKYITGKGFKTAFGSFSDISVIAPELKTAAVNLSSGYYNAHQTHEYINRRHLERTISKAVDIVAEVIKKDFPRYEYIEDSYFDLPKYFDAEKFEKKVLIANLPKEFKKYSQDILDYCTVSEIKDYKAIYGKQWAKFLCADLEISLKDYSAEFYNDNDLD